MFFGKTYHVHIYNILCITQRHLFSDWLGTITLVHAAGTFHHRLLCYKNSFSLKDLRLNRKNFNARCPNTHCKLLSNFSISQLDITFLGQNYLVKTNLQFL